STGIDQRPRIRAALVNWVATDCCLDGWHLELRHVVECCAAALEGEADGLTGNRRVDIRAARLLRVIREQHCNPHLTLRHVAIASDISVRHATRLLKQQTRAGFLMHLHRARVGSASHLLRETTLSVKEVAARVGYGSSSELGKHFKRLVGT